MICSHRCPRASSCDLAPVHGPLAVRLPLLQAVSWRQRNQIRYLPSSWACSPTHSRQVVTSSKGLTWYRHQEWAGTSLQHMNAHGAACQVGDNYCHAMSYPKTMHLTPLLLHPGAGGPQWLSCGGREAEHCLGYQSVGQ